MSRTILATGFVVDAAGEGSIFPSAGGNSADRRVQAVYWRCMVVLFASARLNNPDLDLVLFTNADLPILDGVNIALLLKRFDVEVRLVPLSHRLGAQKTQSWGNVLYFLDVMAALSSEPDDTRIMVVDSDLVVTGDISPSFRALENTDFAGYVVDSDPDEPINGMTRNEMSAAAEALYKHAPPMPIRHFGGELLATSMGAWREHEDAFARLYRQAEAGTGPGADIHTEEHIYSIVFADPALKVRIANRYLKRIWTSPRHSNVSPGDEHLPMWHLPAEKRYGLADLFDDIAAWRIDRHTAPERFRAIACLRCGVPRKSGGKIVRDGVRQVAAKLGYRR